MHTFAIIVSFVISTLVGIAIGQKYTSAAGWAVFFVLMELFSIETQLLILNKAL